MLKKSQISPDVEIIETISDDMDAAYSDSFEIRSDFESNSEGEEEEAVAFEPHEQ